MLVFGFLPVVQDGATDFGQICCGLGFLLVVDLLRRLGQGAVGSTTVFNKALVRRHHLPIWRLRVRFHPLAGHGGEGEMEISMMAVGSAGWRGGKIKLQVGVSHTVAFACCCDPWPKGGHSRCPGWHFSTSQVEALFNGSAPATHFSPIPSGEFPGDGGDGRRRDPFYHSSGGRLEQGLDCFFLLRSRVFNANFRDQVVISFLFLVLHVNPTVF